VRRCGTLVTYAGCRSLWPADVLRVDKGRHPGGVARILVGALDEWLAMDV